MLVGDPNALEVCSSFALSMTLPFGCWSITSTSESWVPRDFYKDFVKSHKSLAAKKSHPAAPWLNSLLDTPWHQRKCLRLCRLTRVKPHCPWNGTALIPCWWFGFLCELLPAPKAWDCSFQVHSLVLTVFRLGLEFWELVTFCDRSNHSHILIVLVFFFPIISFIVISWDNLKHTKNMGERSYKFLIVLILFIISGLQNKI